MRVVTCIFIIALVGCVDRNPEGAEPGDQAPTGADFARAEACGPLLPLGITLDEKFGDGQHGSRVITMREKLARIGAHVEDGGILDRVGRRVLFHRARGWGTTPPPGATEAEAQEIEQLRSQGHLIVLYWTHVPN